MNGSNLGTAFLLTLFAGLSTGLGSTIALVARRTNRRLLCVSLGFSAGVMVYVSMMSILPAAREEFASGLEGGSDWAALGAFFGGILIAAIIDRLVPDYENPHELRRLEEMTDESRMKDPRLLRMGVLSALVIGLHNFPEGMVTFSAALKDPALGLAIAVAIAIHNIPEGIAVSVPVFYATGNRRKAFVYSFLSGLAEPAGALIGFLILSQFMSDSVFGALLGAVAGIMVFISFDELLPAAEEYGEHHFAIYGLVAGMAVMAASLAVLD